MLIRVSYLCSYAVVNQFFGNNSNTYNTDNNSSISVSRKRQLNLLFFLRQQRQFNMSNEHKEKVDSIRSKFESELTTNAELYHPVDVERVRTEEWQVQRFLEHHSGDEKKAFDGLCKALRYKKSFGVHDRADQYFPREFYEMCGAEVYGRDRSGRVILWGTIRNIRHYKETREMSQQFVAHTLERADRAAGAEGFTVVIDNNSGGITNVNMELAKFSLEIMEHYPNCLHTLYSVDLPWLLNSIIKLIMSFMSAKVRELMHFVNSDELAQHLDRDHIPVALKGSREKLNMPTGVKSLRECFRELELPEKFVDKFYKEKKNWL